MTNLVAKFKSRTSPDATGCWVWTGNKRSDGYGYFGMDGKRWRAHRASWQLFRGQIPFGLHVLHKCDNPPCVNPAHLFVGTDADNNADRKNKGHVFRPQGTLSGMAKLNDSQVRAIYSDDRSSRTIGREYGISHTQVLYIKRGRSWHWLTNTMPSGSVIAVGDFSY